MFAVLIWAFGATKLELNEIDPSLDLKQYFLPLKALTKKQSCMGKISINFINLVEFNFFHSYQDEK